MAKIIEYNIAENHIIQLEKLLSRSKTKKDPAYWLYQQNARKPLFMLEAITRLLHRTTKNEQAGKWKKFFKKLEDILGEIDHHDVLVKNFSANKAVKKEYTAYFQKKLDKALRKLNKKLVEKDFYHTVLEEFKHEKIVLDKALVDQMRDQIALDINASAQFFKDHPAQFTDFEEQVHEVRRKIRWTSIYSEAFAGLFILKDPTKKYSWEKEFITPEVIKSPYNKSHVKKGMVYSIHFNRKAFLAMSVVISRLGEIKDKGISIEALAKAIWKSDKETVDPMVKAAKILKLKESEDQLLKQAHDLLHKFYIKYKIHAELLNA
ncbi:MAG: hypothetical protein K0S12_362 [Bacteroidetes bacterium]|nr:hypothetical protein [Bacteroidota bacterium]